MTYGGTEYQELRRQATAHSWFWVPSSYATSTVVYSCDYILLALSQDELQITADNKHRLEHA
jgi:hypothetical protein